MAIWSPVTSLGNNIPGQNWGPLIRLNLAGQVHQRRSAILQLAGHPSEEGQLLAEVAE